MNAIEKNPMKKSPPFILLFGFVFVTLSMLVTCGPSAEDLAAIDYAPLPGDDWQISTLMSRVLIRIWWQSFLQRFSTGNHLQLVGVQERSPDS